MSRPATAVIPPGINNGPKVLASMADWAAQRDLLIVSVCGDVASALKLVADEVVDCLIVHSPIVLEPQIRVMDTSHRPRVVVVANGRPRPEWSPEADPRLVPTRPQVQLDGVAETTPPPVWSEMTGNGRRRPQIRAEWTRPD